jgi:DDB1- and CUL4-associated factor 8
MRLRNDKNLEKHRGCVSTVSFNSDGTITASGSDDRNIVLWDWDAGTIKLQFHSGLVYALHR